MQIVPNEHPVLRGEPYRLAIIGEAPGEFEERDLRPFVGPSGALLANLLTATGITRAACLVGNICQHHPPGNKIETFAWDGPEIAHGLSALTADLEAFNPHCCLLLGNTALRAALLFPFTITQYRGTIFMGNRAGPFLNRKCIASYHPAACLRQYDWTPILRLDLGRARREAETPHLTPPPRTLDVGLPFSALVDRLETVLRDKPCIAFDIEGYATTGVQCYSIATSPLVAFTVPFDGPGGTWWSEAEEAILWQLTSRILSDPSIPKILQNTLYDAFVLAWTHNIRLAGVVDDTMLAHWSMYAELPKSLAFMASIYTAEPFYKNERVSLDLDTHWRYCAKDSAVTYEVRNALHVELADDPANLAHYQFNVSMLDPLLYLETRGIRYDTTKCAARRQELAAEIAVVQAKMDALAGRPLNVNSSVQLTKYLYDDLKLPQRKSTKTGNLTTNYNALLGLAQYHAHPALDLVISLRYLRKRHSDLGFSPDSDGRVRCSYNLVGTETGRMSCSKSPTGNGWNLQTIPKYDRDLFIADPGHVIFQCDLSGADSWTVAAHCARLGDPTMLADLQAGLKLAKAVALMVKHGPEISRLPREELVARSKEISSDDPLYFCCKRAVHGSSYAMQRVLLAQTIFNDTEGKTKISAAEAGRLQDMFFIRYPGIHLWQQWVRKELGQFALMRSATGHVRRFFGRRDDKETWMQALANEPQENTTYATNKALHYLWSHPTNRFPDEPARMVVEPLHQVHDALVGQFLLSQLPQAKEILYAAFNTPLTIANQAITIPFEGAYGPSWGECLTAL